MGNKPDITISVGIPAYARTDYLVEAVQSALNQSFEPVEIIISQNAHPDPATDKRVAETIEHLKANHPRVTSNRNETNCNLSSNINSIADVAKGKYLAIIGDDDRMRPEFLQTLMPMLTFDPDVVFANHHIIDGNGNVEESLSIKNSERYGRNELPAGLLQQDVTKVAVWKCAVPIFSSAIRTDLLRKQRLVDDLQGADTEFFIRLAEHGHSFVFCPDYLTEIRYHAGNLTKPANQYAKLVKHLNDIETDAATVAFKKTILATYTFTTVKKFLIDGRVSEARTFLDEYSSELNGSSSARIAFQKFCLALPGGLPSRVYGAATSIIHALTLRSRYKPF